MQGITCASGEVSCRQGTGNEMILQESSLIAASRAYAANNLILTWLPKRDGIMLNTKCKKKTLLEKALKERMLGNATTN